MPFEMPPTESLTQKMTARLQQAEQDMVAASKNMKMESSEKKAAFNEPVAVRSVIRALRENNDDPQAAEKWLEEQKEIGGGEEAVYARAIEILRKDVGN